MKTISYAEAIREAHLFLLKKYPNVFVIGQGVTSPWYVGNTMNGLVDLFGEKRIIDPPVSEESVTGLAIGASLSGYRPIVVHPRFDFAILAMNSIVNQAAKWGYFLGGKKFPSLTIRAIINRGGEQGAQHSQALHSWFMHVPGIRVVMPSTPLDARDLLIASVLCEDPVLFIDDRWLYKKTSNWKPIVETDLKNVRPKIARRGSDLTFVAVGYSVELCLKAARQLSKEGTSAEVIDLRVLNPFQIQKALTSVKKTRRLIVVDGGWKTCGLGSEVIASTLEKISPNCLLHPPIRISLPDCPAPAAASLEAAYYPTVESIVKAAQNICGRNKNQPARFHDRAGIEVFLS